MKYTLDRETYPRVVEMIAFLHENAVEIEHHHSGKVQFAYSLFGVDATVIPPPRRRKIDTRAKTVVN